MGAVDGKHCIVQCFDRSGSVFFNYKKTFSLVLMAISASDLSFLYVDIGCPGSESDAGIWDKTQFKKCLDSKAITFPPTPPGTIGYHLIGKNIISFFIINY